MQYLSDQVHNERIAAARSAGQQMIKCPLCKDGSVVALLFFARHCAHQHKLSKNNSTRVLQRKDPVAAQRLEAFRKLAVVALASHNVMYQRRRKNGGTSPATPAITGATAVVVQPASITGTLPLSGVDALEASVERAEAQAIQAGLEAQLGRTVLQLLTNYEPQRALKALLAVKLTLDNER